MGLALVAAFIGIPILEIAVFIQAGELVGLWPTLATIVATAVVGAALVRHQGFSTLTRARQSLDAGRFPVEEVFDGLCLLVAGALLVTPGFVTDGMGFLLLTPAIRRVLRKWAGRHLAESGRVEVWSDGRASSGAKGDGVIIDGDFENMDEPRETKPRDSDRPSPWLEKPPNR